MSEIPSNEIPKKPELQGLVKPELQALKPKVDETIRGFELIKRRDKLFAGLEAKIGDSKVFSYTKIRLMMLQELEKAKTVEQQDAILTTMEKIVAIKEIPKNLIKDQYGLRKWLQEQLGLKNLEFSEGAYALGCVALTAVIFMVAPAVMGNVGAGVVLGVVAGLALSPFTFSTAMRVQLIEKERELRSKSIGMQNQKLYDSFDDYLEKAVTDQEVLEMMRAMNAAVKQNPSKYREVSHFVENTIDRYRKDDGKISRQDIAKITQAIRNEFKVKEG